MRKVIRRLAIGYYVGMMCLTLYVGDQQAETKGQKAFVGAVFAVCCIGAFGYLMYPELERDIFKSSK